jgi:mono/diheme cytochrome c family protein
MKWKRRSDLGTRDSGLEGPASTRRSWRNRHPQFGLVAAAILLAAGCRQDMHNQPKYRPLRASAFFENGSSARPLVEGTVARGLLNEDTAFFTGKVGNQLVKEMPFPVTRDVIDRGEDRYNIFCAPCHDRTGSGNGMVVQRGYRQPPSMHIDRLRQVEPGHFFDVMTNGFGAMPDYRSQISPRDRWNIVAYIRALQLAQHAQRADIPGGDPTRVQPPAAGSTGPQKH